MLRLLLVCGIACEAVGCDICDAAGCGCEAVGCTGCEGPFAEPIELECEAVGCGMLLLGSKCMNSNGGLCSADCTDARPHGWTRSISAAYAIACTLRLSSSAPNAACSATEGLL